MAQYHSRINLSAARFPLISALHGRSIILPQHDMNFQKSAIFAGADQDRDVGVPQIFYCHNVMPTEQGFQSIGYNQVVNPITGATDFDKVIPMLDLEGNKFLFVPAYGKNYVFDAPVLSWASVSSIAGLDNNILVTSAHVNGETYVFYDSIGCFIYNHTTKNFDPVTLIGLTVSLVHGIVASNGYLLAWDDTTVYWSSAVNPLDFTPSLLTGASSGQVTDIKGRIVVCLSSINGFIVYSTGNAVGATFTSNIRFPFTFKEIPGSGGIRFKEHVSHEANTEEHYAFTSVGLQILNKTSSKLVFPEVADFLTNRIFEDFSNTTDVFTQEYLTGDPYVKLTVIASRYLVISYGKTTLTHALIHDLALKRWGKVKIDHVDCFEYIYPNLYGEITYAMLEALGDTYDDLIDTMYSELSSSVATAEKPRRTIGFLQKDGTIKLLQFDLGEVNHEAAMLLGKFQFTRGHMIQMLGFEIENINPGANYSCKLYPTYDGKTFVQPIVPYLKSNNGFTRDYRVRHTALNHSWLVKGSFNAVSGQIHYTPAGMYR